MLKKIIMLNFEDKVGKYYTEKINSNQLDFIPMEVKKCFSA